MARRSHPELARQYLRADMHANYTGLSPEHRAIHEGTKTSIARQYPNVHEHALVGANTDFDQPLEPGERSHQQHLRQQYGVHGEDLRARRHELRNPRPVESNPSRRDIADPLGVRYPGLPAGGGRAPSRGRGSSFRFRPSRPNQRTAGGAAALFYDLLAGGVGLSILYLALSDKGSRVVSGTLTGVTNGFARLASPQGLWQSAAPVARTAAPSRPPAPAAGPRGVQALTGHATPTIP